MYTRYFVLLALAFVVSPSLLSAQTNAKPKEVIPHAQSAPPGPALSPQDAIKKMVVPPGFHVELVASEPDIVNPVAMTIDERGRFWITESLEYPKRAAGPGKDRVKVLESTKGDGVYDKITTVIDGLNIPSGIAVGHGGVWVANSPDILYYPLLDRDALKLGKPEVVVTGFGRDDTHELPNSFTWGPDGWLYGLNGVFNRSVVKQKGKTFDFTCALFRIHPRTKEFQLFCEGTSNPWGLAFDTEGSAFVSACVIDHLWHLVETGYYIRQGGPYPPFVSKIGSIVKHKHQKAAYCGLTFFDSDAYPPEYREKLYMGNIHGGCINVDELTRDGSTYFAKPALSAKPQAAAKGVGEGSNFLVANDAWFMPVVQKTGPDGCLYILDWYDRYHCYQDANRDPAGIDRLKGRLYRVVHKDYQPAGKLDLHEEDRQRLIGRLASPNIYIRETAQRVLTEWLTEETPAPDIRRAKVSAALRDLVFDENALRKTRMQALWCLMGTGLAMDDPGIAKLLQHKDPMFRAWGVRAVVDFGRYFDDVRDRVVALAKEPAPDVQVQVAIAARKLKGVEPISVLLDVLAHAGNDKLIPHIVWQNLHPLLASDPDGFLRALSGYDLKKAANVADMLPRMVDRLLAAPQLSPKSFAQFVGALGRTRTSPVACTKLLETLTAKVQTGELAGARLEAFKKELLPIATEFYKLPDSPFTVDAAFLAASLNDPEAIGLVRGVFRYAKGPEAYRLKALATLVAIRGEGVLADVGETLANAAANSPNFRGGVLQTLGKLDDPKVAALVLKHYATMEPELQPKAVDLLTQRPGWSKSLLAEIANKKLSASALNVNQVRKLLATKDMDLIKQVTKVWGTVRTDRNPQREQLVAEMRDLLKKTSGDAKAGALHFKKICAQCHKMHGEGQEVGPDITANGRSDFEQLLSNVFDPSLVIGAGYTATTVVTSRGQTIAGLLVEDSPQRIVLKTQGGKIETIPRGDADQVLASKLSFMPEDVEKQLRPQEIADLFAYLSLDRPPEDPKAKKIPGTPR